MFILICIVPALPRNQRHDGTHVAASLACVAFTFAVL
jgi:hypothetical protein